MKPLTPAEVAQIQDTLAHARAGKATLAQLAVAHDLAEGAALNGALGELRAHIRAMVPAPPMRAEAKGLLVGVASGILTHFLLNSPYFSTSPRKTAQWR